jgi:hypothetical protein
MTLDGSNTTSCGSSLVETSRGSGNEQPDHWRCRFMALGPKECSLTTSFGAGGLADMVSALAVAACSREPEAHIVDGSDSSDNAENVTS